MALAQHTGMTVAPAPTQKWRLSDLNGLRARVRADKMKEYYEALRSGYYGAGDQAFDPMSVIRPEWLEVGRTSWVPQRDEGGNLPPILQAQRDPSAFLYAPSYQDLNSMYSDADGHFMPGAFGSRDPYPYMSDWQAVEGGYDFWKSKIGSHVGGMQTKDGEGWSKGWIDGLNKWSGMSDDQFALERENDGILYEILNNSYDRTHNGHGTYGGVNRNVMATAYYDPRNKEAAYNYAKSLGLKDIDADRAALQAAAEHINGSHWYTEASSPLSIQNTILKKLGQKAGADTSWLDTAEWRNAINQDSITSQEGQDRLKDLDDKRSKDFAYSGLAALASVVGGGLLANAFMGAGLSSAGAQSIGMGAADTLGMGGAFSSPTIGGAAGATAAAAAPSATGSLSQAEMLAAQQLGVDTAGWAGAIEPGAIGFSGLEPGVAEALAASGMPASEAAAAAKVATQAGAGKGLTASQILTAAKGGIGALSSLLGGGGKGGGAGGLAALAGGLLGGGKGGSGGTGMSAAAEESIRTSTDIIKDQYDWFKTKVRPVDNMLADEAMTAGGLADQEAQAGKAAADVAQAYKRIREQRTREMAGLGLDPSSGRYQYGLDAISNAEALAGAHEQNKARETARNVGYDKRLAVSQIGRGIPSSSASSLAGLASQQNQIGRQAQADRQANDMARGYGLNQMLDLGKGIYDFGKSSGWWGDSGNSGGGGSSAPAPSVDTGSSGGGFFENIGWNFGGGGGGGSWDDWLGTADL